MLDTEAAVMATFEFLGNADIDMDDDDGENEEDMYDSGSEPKQNKVRSSSVFCLVEFGKLMIFYFLDIFIAGGGCRR